MSAGYLRIRDALYEQDLEAAYGILDELVEGAPEDPRLAVAKAELCLATEALAEIPTLVHELQRLIRTDAMAWEPRCVLGRLLLRESPLQNTRVALAHSEEAFRISGENPHAGIGLVEAWAATKKTAYARALLARLVEGTGPEALRAQAILDGRLA